LPPEGNLTKIQENTNRDLTRIGTMTGYTVHTGSTEKFSEGWDHIFGNSGSSKKKPSARPGKAKARQSKKKPARKRG
jgi:hypothetical protein